MNKVKIISNVLAVTVMAGITSAALADVKVRLRAGNNFVVEDRVSGTDKFVVNETVGATTSVPTTTGISAGNNAIGDVLDPVQAQDAATKAYADGLDKAGFVADHEGWLHPTIEIGGQTWMADNMYVTSYPGANATGGSHGIVGADIDPSVASGWTIDAGKFSFPSDVDYGDGGLEVSNDAIHRKMFGNFYQWSAMMDNAASDSAVPGTTQGICPSGWHIPTDGDWKVLEGALGMSTAEQDAIGWRGTDQSTQLRAGGSSGFNALLAGRRNTNGNFYYRGGSTYLWSATQDLATTAFRRYLDIAEARVYRSALTKANGFSVRCLKN